MPIRAGNRFWRDQEEIDRVEGWVHRNPPLPTDTWLGYIEKICVSTGPMKPGDTAMADWPK